MTTRAFSPPKFTPGPPNLPPPELPENLAKFLKQDALQGYSLPSSTQKPNSQYIDPESISKELSKLKSGEYFSIDYRLQVNKQNPNHVFQLDTKRTLSILAEVNGNFFIGLPSGSTQEISYRLPNGKIGSTSSARSFPAGTEINIKNSDVQFKLPIDHQQVTEYQSKLSSLSDRLSHLANITKAIIQDPILGLRCISAAFFSFGGILPSVNEHGQLAISVASWVPYTNDPRQPAIDWHNGNDNKYLHFYRNLINLADEQGEKVRLIGEKEMKLIGASTPWARLTWVRGLELIDHHRIWGIAGSGLNARLLVNITEIKSLN